MSGLVLLVLLIGAAFLAAAKLGLLKKGRGGQTEHWPVFPTLGGSTRRPLRPPDVVGRSTTARMRGRTVWHRGAGAIPQRPQRGGQ